MENTDAPEDIADGAGLPHPLDPDTGLNKGKSDRAKAEKRKSQQDFDVVCFGNKTVVQKSDDQKGQDVYDGFCRKYRYYRRGVGFGYFQRIFQLRRQNAKDYVIGLSRYHLQAIQ